MKVIAIFLAVFAVGIVECSDLWGSREFMEKQKEGSRWGRNWIQTGRVPVSEKMRLTFAIKLQNVEKLDEIFWAVSDPTSPKYGKYLTRDQVNSLVEPRAEDIELVKSWLTSHDIQDIHYANGFLTAMVPANLAETLLDCEFFMYRHVSGKKSLARCSGDYSLPRQIKKVVDFVGGVKHLPKIKSRPQLNKAPSLFVDPAFIRDQYSIGDTVGKATNNLQSVVQFIGQFYSSYDLDEFFVLFYQSAIGQQPTIVGPDGFFPGAEASLDIEYIMSIGGNVPTWFWSNPDNDTVNNEPFLYWLEQMAGIENPPLVNSVSYGEDEDSDTPDQIVRVNIEFQRQGARGISILFASGDSGVGGDGDSCSQFDPDFPASSPYVTAVGGTTLGWFETGEEVVAPLSGGGFSNQSPAPAYQVNAVNSYLAQNADKLPPSSYYNRSGRAYPDISALAENYIIVLGLVPFPGVAGTSCAAPVFSGVISLLNDLRLQANKPPLGFLNPFIYQTAAKNPKAFTDITKGSNPGCGTEGFVAASGWDPSSGWGSPNYQELAKAVASLP